MFSKLTFPSVRFSFEWIPKTLASRDPVTPVPYSPEFLRPVLTPGVGGRGRGGRGSSRTKVTETPMRTLRYYVKAQRPETPE